MNKEKFIIHETDLNIKAFIIRRENDRGILSRLKLYEYIKENNNDDRTFSEVIKTVSLLCKKFNCSSNGVIFSEIKENILRLLNFLYEMELI